ncbi:predicted protein [Naegleria gruberi]|uniref:Predicted protein n=1 Tax=Naegleria gruberi TaxID=5762 RepID=D2V1K7_NAEGR|nr:uncharacterized protein NAEGRDRAFT_62613 [Naegleria gruberi]EFC49327.1 predicted protein [Naegleria gruberi]|eukprot:XP_002682071.1 predicted protein [Naegleria gruberi strain NEG-M]
MGSSCSSSFVGKNVSSKKQARKSSSEDLYKTSEKSSSPFPNDTTSNASTKVTMRPSHSQTGLQYSSSNNTSSGSVKGASSNHQPTIASSLSTSTLASVSSKKTKKKSTASSCIIVQPDLFDPVVYAEREIERRQRDPRTTTLRMSLDNFKFPSEKSLVSNQTC